MRQRPVCRWLLVARTHVPHDGVAMHPAHYIQQLEFPATNAEGDDVGDSTRNCCWLVVVELPRAGAFETLSLLLVGAWHELCGLRATCGHLSTVCGVRKAQRQFHQQRPSDPCEKPHELRFDDLGALGTQLFVEFSAGLGDHERLDDGPQGDVGAGCSWGFCC